MLQILRQPNAEPLHRDEVKTYSRVGGTADDKLIDRLIGAARRYVEQFTGRPLVCTTYQLAIDRFPAIIWGVRSPAMQPLVLDNMWYRPGIDAIHLVVGPVVKVNSLKYIDGQGVTQTYDPANYIVDTITEPARLTPLPSRPWPATQFRINAVTVEWVAGYAAPFTANATADTLTVRGRTFANGDVVRLSNSGGALPAGLTVNTDYYVVNASGDGTTIQLSTTAAGTPVDLTDTGAGLSFLGVIPDDILAALQLVVGDLYEHREAQTEYTLESNSAVRNLLYPYRIYPVQDIQ